MKFLKKKSKKCSRCNEYRDINLFGKDSKMKYGILNQCNICRKEYRNIYNKRNKNRAKEVARLYRLNTKDFIKISHKKYIESIKIKVYEHYGNKCNCCGEEEIKFLSIDHINNDGAQQRRSIVQGNMYLWIIKSNFPKDLQLLCYNCNCGKKVNNGICPHKK